MAVVHFGGQQVANLPANAQIVVHFQDFFETFGWAGGPGHRHKPLELAIGENIRNFGGCFFFVGPTLVGLFLLVNGEPAK
jgi:hypothetical protein